jgi:tripartite-type tricarboxylate transporter receptor subunit TctC
VPALPGVPPLASIYPGFETSLWHGYFTTAGTPADRIERLNAEIVKALRSPALKERVEAGGGEVAATTVAEFAEIVKTDTEKYAKLVAISGSKPN